MGEFKMWTSMCTWMATKIMPKLGYLFSLILFRTGTTIYKDLMNELYNRKALEFVKELNNRTDLTTSEKASEFNKKFIEWLKSSGKAVSISVINLLRELAVNAIKSGMNNVK